MASSFKRAYCQVTPLVPIPIGFSEIILLHEASQFSSGLPSPTMPCAPVTGDSVHTSASSLTLCPLKRGVGRTCKRFFTLKQLQFHFCSSQHAGSGQVTVPAVLLWLQDCAHIPLPACPPALQQEEQLFQQGFHYFIPNPESVVVHTVVLFDGRLVIGDQGVDSREDKFRNCRDKRQIVFC